MIWSFADPLYGVRLVGGENRCEGRVELWKDGQWGTVCDDHWKKEIATMVCQELRCGPVMKTPAGRLYYQSCLVQHIWNPMCQGTELTLAECEEDVVDCDNHEEDAGAICGVPLHLEGTRLVNGPGPCTGRVEVKYAGEWGTVCNEDWNLQDAKVLCHELGCGRPLLTKGSCKKDQQGRGEIWLSQVKCRGSEASLRDCPTAPVGENNCTHYDDVWVQCEEPFALRLVDGGDKCSGRVEVFHKGLWGSVCNDGWGEKEDQVVCQEMKCGKALLQKSGTRKRFGLGKGQIWLDDVSCKGKEASLKQCQHRLWGRHDCTHREDVSVVCSGMLEDYGEPRLGWGVTFLSSA
uniref:Soluble scavenger receptor cysteine-rich domain-containing protein SSC5D n=1 Tax=Monodelphis domestica TaxID=13616 RepID=A0A5F8GNV9_MONDO